MTVLPLNDEEPTTTIIHSVIGTIVNNMNCTNLRRKKRQRVVCETTTTTSERDRVEIVQQPGTMTSTTSTSSTAACTRIANRLYRLEPSNISSICSTVSAALNVHLVILGDSIYNNKYSIEESGLLLRSTSINNNNDITQIDVENHHYHQQHQRGIVLSATTPYYYEERIIIEEDIDYNDSDNDYDECIQYNNNDDVEPILNWFYYDEPNVPIHPALEYETGRIGIITTATSPTSTPIIHPKTTTLNIKNKNSNRTTGTTVDDTDVLLLHSGENTITTLDTATNTTSSYNHDNEFFDIDTDDDDNNDDRNENHRRHRVNDNDNNNNRTYQIFNYNQCQYFLTVLLLVLSGSMNVVTAKAQSISMYNYPIFLSILHALLAIPVSFGLTYWFSTGTSTLSKSNDSLKQASRDFGLNSNANSHFNDIADPLLLPVRPITQQLHTSNAALLVVSEPFVNTNQTQSAMTVESITSTDIRRHRTINSSIQISFSRLLLIGLLDSIATTVQIITTTYVAGSVVVLLPAATSVVILYILSILKLQKKQSRNNRTRTTQSHEHNTITNHNNNNNDNKSKKCCTKQSVILILGLLLVVLGTIAYVVLPIVTSRHSPKYYCDVSSVATSFNNKNEQGTNMNELSTTVCQLCRQATSEDICLQYNTNIMKNNTSIRMDFNHVNVPENTSTMIDDNNNNNDVCQWIPFVESTKEKEFIMTAWWSVVLAISTIPMVFSALLKQKLTRVECIPLQQKLIDSEVVTRNQNIDSSNPTTIMDSSQRVGIETNRSTDSVVDTNHQSQSQQKQQQRLHPMLQRILDDPTYWNAWIAVIQFVATLVLIIPSYYLIQMSTINVDNSFDTESTTPTSITSDDENFSLSNIPVDDNLGLFAHSTLIMSNVWDGFLCYGKRIDTIHTGCHPDIGMCSSGLAFWTVNIHCICSCLYKISFLSLLRAITTNSISKAPCDSRNRTCDRRHTNSCEGPNTIEENNITNRVSDIDTRPLLGRQKTTIPPTNIHTKMKLTNYHRYLFFALVATIPLADIIFWTLPLASWHHKYLDALYMTSLQNFNTLSWDENIIGLFAIVLGTILMHLSRVKKSKSKYKYRPIRSLSSQCQLEETNTSNTGDCAVSEQSNQNFLFDSQQQLLSPQFPPIENTLEMNTSNNNEQQQRGRPMIIRRRHSDYDCLLGDNSIGTSTGYGITSSPNTEQLHFNSDDDENNSIVIVNQCPYSILTSDV